MMNRLLILTVLLTTALGSGKAQGPIYPHSKIPDINAPTATDIMPDGADNSPEDSDAEFDSGVDAKPKKIDGASDSRKEAANQKEFQNVYHDITYPVISTGIAQNFTIVNGSVTSRLTVPSGTRPTDAANVSQLYVFYSTGVAKGGQLATTSATFQPFPTLTASITPQSATHRVRISINSVLQNNTAGNAGVVTIKRGSTDLANGFAGGLGLYDSAGITSPVSFNIIDNPATTSLTTYQVNLRSLDGANSTTLGRSDTICTLILDEIGP